MVINLGSIYLVVIILSWLIAGMIRRYALSSGLMDIPNNRSSHLEPTPRGGGIATVFSFISGLIALWVMSVVNDKTVVGLMGGGLMVSFVGFFDDRGHVAARWRLLVHFGAAVWLLFWLGGGPPVSLFGGLFDLGWLGHLLTAISLVWLLNLYNFMDGIDGIACVEAISSCLVAGLLMFMVINHDEVGSLSILMSASVAGLLVWNFPPAKIFMGDTGSGFVGLMMGAFALCSAYVAPQMLWSWLILLGVFIVDATYTLLMRIVRGDKVYEAHRTHAYQYAARKYASHMKVLIAVMCINIFWLAPWASAVSLGHIDGELALLISYTPLILLARHYRAGEVAKP